jgi:hypothetical protein
MSKRCKACGHGFRPHPQVKNQTYCSAKACQRERRRRWHQERRQNDPDYRDNQSRAHKEWLKNHPKYWSQYRETNPSYAERNREQQHRRNRQRQASSIAKMDVSTQVVPLPSGRYQLTPISAEGIAKMDSWLVELVVVTRDSADLADDCKERT